MPKNGGCDSAFGGPLSGSYTASLLILRTSTYLVAIWGLLYFIAPAPRRKAQEGVRFGKRHIHTDHNLSPRPQAMTSEFVERSNPNSLSYEFEEEEEEELVVGPAPVMHYGEWF